MIRLDCSIALVRVAKAGRLVGWLAMFSPQSPLPIGDLTRFVSLVAFSLPYETRRYNADDASYPQTFRHAFYKSLGLFERARTQSNLPLEDCLRFLS
jgi:hypothetical protein